MGLRSDSAGFVRSGAFLLLSLLLAIGACAGIIYWAWHGSLLGVVLSAVLPGSGASALVTGQTWRTRPGRG
jgi:hypothetical protein